MISTIAAQPPFDAAVTTRSASEASSSVSQEIGARDFSTDGSASRKSRILCEDGEVGVFARLETKSSGTVKVRVGPH